MDMGFLVLIGIACIFAGLTAWIAAQKSRSALEGFALGFLFGPFGVLVEVFLPMKAQLPGGSTPGSPGWSMLNEPGVVEMIANRFRMALEEAEPNWKLLPYRQKCACSSRSRDYSWRSLIFRMQGSRITLRRHGECSLRRWSSVIRTHAPRVNGDPWLGFLKDLEGDKRRGSNHFIQLYRKLRLIERMCDGDVDAGARAA